MLEPHANVLLNGAPRSMGCLGSCYHNNIMWHSAFFTQIKSHQRQNSGNISPISSTRRGEINLYGDRWPSKDWGFLNWFHFLPPMLLYNQQKCPLCQIPGNPRMLLLSSVLRNNRYFGFLSSTYTVCWFLIIQTGKLYTCHFLGARASQHYLLLASWYLLFELLPSSVHTTEWVAGP